MIHDVVHPAVEVFNEVIKNVLVTTDGRFALVPRYE